MSTQIDQVQQIAYGAMYGIYLFFDFLTFGWFLDSDRGEIRAVLRANYDQGPSYEEAQRAYEAACRAWEKSA